MLVTGLLLRRGVGQPGRHDRVLNNPISGLTLATTIVAALVMVIIGCRGPRGVMAVLGVAAVVCVSSAVAGEMLQDLKVGHILGGTPWKMQVGDVIGVVVAGLLLFFPLYVLHFSDIAAEPRGRRLRRPNLPAPQAGLMAALSQGIVGGEMAWPLVIVGIAMGIALILVRVKSPMLFSVGMYLPLETTFAIFLGGIFRGFVDRMAASAAAYNAGPEGPGRERRASSRLRPDRRARR
jgi:putative OPT family oligopeptide transporter